jgi:phosphoribosyl-AMP cyclohydrolase
MMTERITHTQLNEIIDWKKSPLIPAIIQDADTNEVLMLAYMNQQSLERTLLAGEAIFYSRSRQKLWHKGQTSGNRMLIQTIDIDCDGDTLLLHVVPLGPACHTGEMSCFYRKVEYDYGA